MKKSVYIFLTLLIMIVFSALFIRIIDSTVQIDNNTGMLVLFLILLNFTVGFFSFIFYKFIIKK